MRNIGGIYKISVNEYIYIGKAKDISVRWKRHLNELKNGVHGNRIMQRLYDKYGIDTFTFTIVEIVEDSAQLTEREQYWLDWLFNNNPRDTIINIVRNSYEVFNNTGTIASDETREKQRIAMEERYADKVYSLRAPDGTLYEGIKNLNTFAKEHGLYAHALRGVLNGTNFHAHGWTLPENKFPTYTLISPDGTVYDNIVRLKPFCEEHGLDWRLMHAVYKGTRKTHKGWMKG